jgi:hypothetical protein
MMVRGRRGLKGRPRIGALISPEVWRKRFGGEKLPRLGGLIAPEIWRRRKSPRIGALREI